MLSQSLASNPASEEAGLNWKLQILAFVIVVIVIVSRRPDAIFNPQFYAEDGSLWYSDAYSIGWLTSLAAPDGGYLNTWQRLAASAALAVPFHLAPLVMNLLGIAIQALPVNVLLSSRCSNWGSLGARVFQSAFYVALPNSSEIHVNITNSQFHLALLAFLLAFAKPPSTLIMRIVDCCLLLVGGLSGPFSIVMLPLLAVYWWKKRQHWSLLVLGIIALCAGVQILELFRNSVERPAITLGASFPLLIRILSRQVYVAALLGKNMFAAGDQLFAPLTTAIVGSAVISYAVLRGNLELRLFNVFCFALLAAGLYHPLLAASVPVWPLLLSADGMRYWFFPMLAFLWSLVWLANQNRLVTAKVAAACLLLLGLTGIVEDWRHPAYQDQHFPLYARQFEQAAVGDLVPIPLVPQGWVLNLTKKGPNCPHLPKGFVEQPVPDAVVSGQLATVGWVTATEKISGISLYLDHLLSKTVVLTVSRPDVDHLYPSSPIPYKGWQTSLDISKLSPGKHELTFRAAMQSGCNAEFGIRSFQVGP